jgi:hypothetical protein
VNGQSAAQRKAHSIVCDIVPLVGRVLREEGGPAELRLIAKLAESAAEILEAEEERAQAKRDDDNGR